jgi:hypothetical protein
MHISNNLNDHDEIAIVCHDAGGANQLLYEINRLQLKTIPRVLAKGPSEAILQATLPYCNRVDSLSELLKNVNCLISATSWSSDLEFEARKIAKLKNIRSITALDHWTNYRERFIRNGEQVLPDEIWVFDDKALSLATKTFPSVRICLLPNEYLKAQLEKIPPLQSVKDPEILYLLEPLSKRSSFSKTAEFEALDCFLRNLKTFGAPEKTRIRLRLHPSECISKYDNWIKSNSVYPITIDDSASLGEAVAKAGWVCGATSAGLYLAQEAKRKIFCSISPDLQDGNVPFSGMIFLTEIC